MITLTVKTKSIQCVFPENLKERFYNFSLRVHSTHLESESDHSTNFKNPMFAMEETNEEDFQNQMEENKKMKMKKYTEEMKYKANYEKMINGTQSPTHSPLKKLGSSETFKVIAEKNIINLQPSTFERKYQKGETVVQGLNIRKDVEWKYEVNDPVAPKLQASFSLPILIFR